jgi:hypothetical protein
MKDLIEYINEGLLKGQANTLASGDSDISSIYVEDFINSIYLCPDGEDKVPMTISDKTNNKGQYEVVIHASIKLRDRWTTPDGKAPESLTNGMFIIKKVEGDFRIPILNLNSLEGCPEEVDGNVLLGGIGYGGHITTLKGAPKKVGGMFKIVSWHLESLEYLPKIGKGFVCDANNLKSLKGCPKHIKGDFRVMSQYITDLEHGPDKVDGNYTCSNCGSLKSLKGCPKHIKGNFNCSWNRNLTTLEGCPEKVDGDFIKGECGKKFLMKSIEKFCTVKGKIRSLI